MKPDIFSKLIHLFNGSYDACSLLRSYLSPIDLFCFQIATGLSQFHFGTRNPSNQLDVTSVLRSSGISKPKEFLQTLKSTNSAYITGDLFDLFDIPIPETWWTTCLTLADAEDPSKNPSGLEWDELPHHLSDIVFSPTKEDDAVTHFSTPCKELDGVIRQWLNLHSGVIGVIYDDIFRLVWMEGSEAEFAPIDTKICAMTPSNVTHDVMTLATIDIFPKTLVHTPSFCRSRCKVDEGKECTLPADIERLRLFTGVEVFATDVSSETQRDQER
ncbi:hypothetical protein ABW19_dt0207626 [Dactylella cylindrospora]|nr:hypothetical protein ABW19_dt0207626 [Dactylella cylindrospora]